MGNNKRLPRCKNLHHLVSLETNSRRLNLWIWLRSLNRKVLMPKLTFKHLRLVYQKKNLPKLKMFKLLLLNKPLKKLLQLMVPPLKLLIPQLNNSSLLNNWLKYKQKPRHKLMLNKQLPKQHLLKLLKKQRRRFQLRKQRKHLKLLKSQLLKPQPPKLPLKLKSNLD